MENKIICNYNSICIDPDCQFYHNIHIKDRKVVKKLYDNLINPNKKEENPNNRKKNCINGQICYNPNCGFRHRLNFKDRMILVEGFNDAKLDMTKNEKIKKVPDVELFNISKKNSFECLGVD